MRLKWMYDMFKLNGVQSPKIVQHKAVPVSWTVWMLEEIKLKVFVSPHSNIHIPINIRTHTSTYTVHTHTSDTHSANKFLWRSKLDWCLLQMGLACLNAYIYT